jgi:hypothetical protein
MKRETTSNYVKLNRKEELRVMTQKMNTIGSLTSINERRQLDFKNKRQELAKKGTKVCPLLRLKLPTQYF